MKLAVFLPNWIGDACMSIPTLRALTSRDSAKFQLVGVSRPGPYGLLRDQGWIDDWLVYKPRAQGKLLNRRRLIGALKDLRCDGALLLTNSLGSAFLAALAGIKHRIGYARDSRSWLLTDRLPVPSHNGRHTPIPAIDYYARMAEHLGVPVNDRRMELHIDRAIEEQLDLDWNKMNFQADRPTVVINNAAAKNPERLWPNAYVEQLASTLAVEHDMQVLLHCGPAEAAIANEMATRLNHPLIRSMGQWRELPLGLSPAIFQRASVIVTTDSGARHMAVATNRPVISLFGPTDPEWTTTYNIPEKIVQADPRCPGCQRRDRSRNGSNRHCQCMALISPEQVLRDVRSICSGLDESRRARQMGRWKSSLVDEPTSCDEREDSGFLRQGKGHREVNVAFIDMCAAAFGDQHGTNHHQKGDSQHLHRWIVFHKFRDGSRKNHHDRHRDHNRRDHYPKLVGHSYGGDYRV